MKRSALLMLICATATTFAVSACASLPPDGQEKRTSAIPTAYQPFKPGSSSGSRLSMAADNMQPPIETATITVGPFDLHRKYRSMEGPYVRHTFKIADIIQSKHLSIPESSVQYVEGRDGMPGKAAAMNASDTAPVNPDTVKPEGLVDTSGQKRELLWFKGIKLQVLDENGKTMPTAEFICHLNVDVDLRQRDALFKKSDRPGNSRIMTLTQGQTEFNLPDGFAVPVASDEQWKFTFQAANRTTDKHRRLKHLCTLEFIRDSDVNPAQPLKALTWFNPYIAVVIDSSKALAPEGEHEMSCLATSSGESAPNMVPGSDIKDAEGRKLNGHWAVPPGKHTYECPITEQLNRGFAAKDRLIHAVWTHVHPLCTESSLMICEGDKRKKVFTAATKTSTAHGLQIENIETISSQQGIPMAGGAKYMLQSTYKNTTKDTQDSMVALGIFCADDKFVKPNWGDPAAAKSEQAAPVLALSWQPGQGLYCGIRSAGAASCSAPPASDEYGGTDKFPVFDTTKDGPLLSSAKELEIETTAGCLHIALDPEIAPVHATQMFKMMTRGLFNGTKIHRYEPGFVLQISNAESKADGKAVLTNEQYNLLRRLPLEVESQKAAKTMHEQWVLSMARYNPTDSAVSSFSILLGRAPHLDNEYTIFGSVVPDQISKDTIQSITKDWNTKHPHIVSIKELRHSQSK